MSIINHPKVKASDGVRANAKTRITNNPLKYLLGKIAPKIFGMPLHVQAVLRDAVGNIKATRHVYNTVTTAGKQMIADQLLASPSLTKPTHMAIGTGTGGTTALNTELDRNALTSKTRSGAVVTATGDWAAGDGTGTITEAGLFDASSSGNMHTYASFTGIAKAAADSLSIAWAITVS